MRGDWALLQVQGATRLLEHWPVPTQQSGTSQPVMGGSRADPHIPT